MPPRVEGRPFALLALVLATAGLTACAGSDEVPPPSSSPTAAGRFSDARELGETIQAAALAAGSASGEIDVQGPDGTARGTAEYRFAADGTDLSAQAVLAGPIDADVALVLLDDVLYLKVPPAFRWLAPTPWVSTPADGPAAGVAGTLQLQTLLPGSDLAAATDAQLRYLGLRRTPTGVAEVYQVEQPDRSRTYWVGEGDLVSRVETTSADGTTSTAGYGAWGRPVTISPPPAAEVSDLPG